MRRPPVRLFETGYTPGVRLFRATVCARRGASDGFIKGKAAGKRDTVRRCLGETSWRFQVRCDALPRRRSDSCRLSFSAYLATMMTVALSPG